MKPIESDVKQQNSALKSENLKLQKKIVKLEASILSITNKCKLLEIENKKLKNKSAVSISTIIRKFDSPEEQADFTAYRNSKLP